MSTDFSAHGISFRNRVLPEDLDGLQRLQDDLFPVRYSQNFYQSLVSGRDPHNVCILATNRNEIIGVASARVIFPNKSGTPPSPLSRRISDREGYISTLGVHPEFRRIGLGRALLHRIIDFLRQEFRCKTATLHVHVENSAAIALYKNEGFRVDKILQNHYFFDEKHHDALELVKDLRADKAENSWSSCVVL